MRRPLAVCAALVAVTLVLGCSAFGSSRSAAGAQAPAAAAPPAPPSLYLSPTGSDGASCTQTAPCVGFDRAYHAAKPGQHVVVAAGTYGDQEIEVDATKTAATANVVFEPAKGAAVTVGYVDVFGSHLELRNMTLAGWHAKDSADGDVFRSIRAANFYISSAKNISIVGGSYGPQTDNDDAQIRPACPGCALPQNILIDGVVFHDALNSPGSDAHTECIQIGEIDGLTIRNSRFVNCEHHNMFLSPWWGGPVENVLLENNIGGVVRSGYYGFRLAAGDPGNVCKNVIFRYNSAETAFVVQCNQVDNVQLIANVGPFPTAGCDTRIVFVRNVWDGTKCGPTDTNAPSGFVDPAISDLHLKPGSAAIGHGVAGSFPKRDIDGQLRPISPPAKAKAKKKKVKPVPDAGADERP
jgi:hypothetical protein